MVRGRRPRDDARLSEAAVAIARWPCLMYHEVEDDHSTVGYFAVTATTFTRHADRARELGRPFTSLEQRLVAGTGTALTFDDGHAGCSLHASPALADRGMSATFFVVTDWVGQPGRVTWDQLREMVASGMSVQSHSHTHPFLSTLSRQAAEEELARSKGLLESHLGVEVSTISLPNGDAPRSWGREEYARLGYRWVATSRFALNLEATVREAGLVARLTVRRDTTSERLESMLVANAAALWVEGTRLGALNRLRSFIGVDRYSRWRRRLLDAVSRDGA